MKQFARDDFLSVRKAPRHTRLHDRRTWNLFAKDQRFQTKKTPKTNASASFEEKQSNLTCFPVASHNDDSLDDLCHNLMTLRQECDKGPADPDCNHMGVFL